jgi:raffinose/stachyose/melibiose transport system permease protein
MEKVLRDKKMILLFISPALILYVSVMLYPILYAGYISLFQWDILGSTKFIGFQNYVRMFTRDDLVLRTLQHTVVILVVSLVGQQILGFLFASVLSHGTKFKNLFKNLFFLPSVLSSAAVGSMWSFIYNPKGGLINSFFRGIGLGQMAHQWLTDERLALGAIAFVVVWQFTAIR